VRQITWPDPPRGAIGARRQDGAKGRVEVTPGVRGGAPDLWNAGPAKLGAGAVDRGEGRLVRPRVEQAQQGVSGTRGGETDGAAAVGIEPSIGAVATEVVDGHVVRGRVAG